MKSVCNFFIKNSSWYFWIHLWRHELHWTLMPINMFFSNLFNGSISISRSHFFLLHEHRFPLSIRDINLPCFVYCLIAIFVIFAIKKNELTMNFSSNFIFCTKKLNPWNQSYLLGFIIDTDILNMHISTIFKYLRSNRMLYCVKWHQLDPPGHGSSANSQIIIPLEFLLQNIPSGFKTLLV